MALSTLDFLHGVDMTGINPVTGADLNSLIDQAIPIDDGGDLGKGLVIATIDSALNTPVVPDAAVTTKWKRYLWRRVPHVSAVIQLPSIYAWCDNAVSDAIYLKWLQITNEDHQTVIDNTADILKVRSLIKDRATITNQISAGGAGNALLGANARTINGLFNYNTAILGQISADTFTPLITSQYHISGWAVGYKQSHQLYLVRTDTGAVIASGSDMYNNGVDIQTKSHIDGIVTLNVGVNYRLDHYFAVAQVDGLGKYSGIHPTATAYNIYMNMTFVRMYYP